MRIALITKQAFSIPNFRGPLLREMVRRGARVYALAADFDDEQRAAVAALGVEPIDFSLAPTALDPFRDLADLARLTALLRRLDLDATLACFIKPVIYGSLAARLAGVKRRFALVEGAGYVFADDAGGRFGRRRAVRAVAGGLYRLGLAQTERVFLLNPDDVTLFTESGMAAAAKVTRLPGIGVDLDHYAEAPLPEGPPVFLLVARLLVEKGVRVYAEAARRVKARHPDARFLLVGAPDPNPNSLPVAEVRGWVDEGLVEWPGAVPDVRPWLARANVFVLPSFYREGLPRSTMEAMATGRAIVTTDWVGCRETVEPGLNGFLVPPRDPDALADAMARFCDDPAMIARMGAASRRLAEARFDVHRINATMLAAMDIFGACPVSRPDRQEAG